MKNENGRGALRAWGELCYPSHLPEGKAWLLCPRVLGHGDLPWLYPAEGAVGLLQDPQALPTGPRLCALAEAWPPHHRRWLPPHCPLEAFPAWPVVASASCTIGTAFLSTPAAVTGLPLPQALPGPFLIPAAVTAPCIPGSVHGNPTLHNCAQGFP